MNEPRQDRDLHEAFRRLRDRMREPGRSPAFQPMLERARREALSASTPTRTKLPGPFSPGGLRRWHRSTPRVGLAVAAALVVLLVPGARDPELEFERLVSAYGATASTLRSPTSRLLEVPGLELVRSLPAIGVPRREATQRDMDDHPVPAPEVRS